MWADRQDEVGVGNHDNCTCPTSKAHRTKTKHKINIDR